MSRSPAPPRWWWSKSPGVRVAGEADVDAHVGGRLGVAVARARDLQRLAEQRQRGEREDLVGVEGPVVGGGVHRAILGGRIQRAMDDVELVIFFLLIAVAVFGALARVLDVPYPIALVVGGSLVGFAPGVPDVVLDPDLVLLIFLPPLLFNLAYFSSVRDLRAAMRVIVLNAVGLVLLTTVLVAVAVHAAVPGMPWAAAFALGAIVSPTDPLAATAILRRLNVPRRLTSTLEGESLINDGTALVVYRTAVAAAAGGTFDLLHATGRLRGQRDRRRRGRGRGRASSCCGCCGSSSATTSSA